MSQIAQPQVFQDPVEGPSFFKGTCGQLHSLRVDLRSLAKSHAQLCAVKAFVSSGVVTGSLVRPVRHVLHE